MRTTLQTLLSLATAATISIAAQAQTSTVGATDNSDGWWAAFSDSYEVPAGSLLTYSFTNHSDKAANWHNFILVTSTAARATDGYSEYFVLRADNYGWGNSDYSASNLVVGNYDWDKFTSEMDGAQVTANVLNANSTIFVSCDITTASGAKWTIDYNQPGSAGSIFSFLSVENAHLTDLTATVTADWTLSATPNVPLYLADGLTPTMPTRGVTVKAGSARIPYGTATLSSITADGKVTATYADKSATAQFELVSGCTLYGATDFTTAYNTVKTTPVKVEAGAQYTISYQVRSAGANNWDNAHLFLTNQAADADATWLVRADNYAVQAGNAFTGTTASNWNWDLFATSIDGSVYTITVTNNGDGTADVQFDLTDGGGASHYQSFSGLPVSADDLYAYVAPESAYILVPAAKADDANTGLDNPQPDPAISVIVSGGSITVQGADTFQVYDLSGRKAPATGLKAGLYVVSAAGHSQLVRVGR